MASYVVGKRKVTVLPKDSIGKGGEADIFKISDYEVLKIYKPPTHPDFEDEPLEQEAARRRLDERQKKLPAFPQNLPARIVVPKELAIDPATGLIVGFSMRYLKDAEVMVKLRDDDVRSKLSGTDIADIFRDMHATVIAAHKRGVIFGDFNDLNVMRLGKEAHFIDADSYQFDPFLCFTYTQRFTDPLLCDPKTDKLVLVKPYVADSDWYAYAVMLMQSLLRVDPYGGVYRPKNKKDFVVFDERPLHRITVFHPEVGYPKNAIPFGILPDDLLHYWLNVFMKDLREEFPLRILDDLRWTTCTSCGLEHARRVCPNCSVAAAAVVERVRGTVSARRFFMTSGQILTADFQGGKMRYLYYQDGQFKRETGEVVVRAELKPHMRFRIMGDDTLIGLDKIVHHFSGAHPHGHTQHVVDTYNSLPMFGTDGKNAFFVQNGRLLRNEAGGQEFIGGVLEEQTLFWVGRKLGFGFYRAGELFRAFVFNPGRRGINDSVLVPRIRGQLIDTTAYVGDDRCWFFTTTREKRRTINRCTVVSATGTVLATAEADDGDGSWLGSLRGKCVVSSFLFAATDDGIVRVEVDGKTLSVTKEFPDTKTFIHSGNNIVPGDGGLYAIGKHEIVHVTIG